MSVFDWLFISPSQIVVGSLNLEKLMLFFSFVGFLLFLIQKQTTDHRKYIYTKMKNLNHTNSPPPTRDNH